jgi:hypothetical protein
MSGISFAPSTLKMTLGWSASFNDGMFHGIRVEQREVDRMPQQPRQIRFRSTANVIE